MLSYLIFFFFFFNDTATTEIYTLSLHDALPIYILAFDQRKCSEALLKSEQLVGGRCQRRTAEVADHWHRRLRLDRKSTRLNSSHLVISYAVFCLKKKKECTTCESRAQRPRAACN